jgi:hypothetical protein
MDSQLNLFGFAPNGSGTSTPITLYGTDNNPRHVRVVRALLVGPLTREQLDRVAGCSNGPQLISDLRDMGLGHAGLLCTMMTGTDRDGRRVKYGVYSLTDDGRRAASEWLAEIARKEVSHV